MFRSTRRSLRRIRASSPGLPVICAAVCSALLPAVAASQVKPAVRLRVVHGARGHEVQLRHERGLVATLDSVKLSVLDAAGSAKLQIVSFRRARRLANGSWELESGLIGEHRIRLQLRALAANSFALRLDDDVDVRTAIQELSLSWRMRSPKPIALRLPFLVQDPQDLAPDVTWSMPVALAQAGNVYVSIEAKQRRDARALPAFLAADAPKRASAESEHTATLSHGLSAYALRAGNLFTRSVNRSTSQRDTRTIEHEIHFGTAEDADRALAAIARRMWDASAGDTTSEAHEAPKGSQRGMLDRTLREAARNLVWITEAKAKNATAALACLAPSRQAIASGIVAVRETGREHPLASALALFRYASRRGDENLMEKARGVCRLFLSAPSRGGIFRTRARVELGRRRVRWDFDEQGCYASQDCARVASTLLEWADRDVELRNACLERARELGDFFVGNRQGDGSIPARFDPDLDARRGALWAKSGETATCGLFLVQLWRRLEDARYLEAAVDAHGAMLDALLGKSLLDREAERLLRDPSRTRIPLRSSRVLIDASLLAFELANAKGDRSFERLGVRWIELLLPLQQTWSPPFFSVPLRGGMYRSNFDGLWSEVSGVRAATAFFEAWRRTGEEQLLDRAAAKLRAVFASGGTGWGANGEDVAEHGGDPTRGLAAMASSIEDLLARTGNAVVDLDSGTGRALFDCALFDIDTSTRGSVSLRLETAKPSLSVGAQSRKMRVRFFGGKEELQSVRCNGKELPPRPTRELRAGIFLPAASPLVLELDAPLVQSASRTLEIEGKLLGIGNVDAQKLEVHALVRSERDEGQTPLRIERTRTRERGLRLRGRVPRNFVEEGARLVISLHAKLDNQTVHSAERTVEVRSFDRIDCGAKSARGLVTRVGSRRRSFPDGTGNGRFTDPNGVLTYELPIRESTLSVRARIRYVGNADILAGQSGSSPVQTLAASDGSTWREAEVVLRARELWEKGTIQLRFRARDNSDFGLSWLEWEALGAGSSARDLGARTERARRPELRLAVLPTATAAAPRHDVEALRMALFGDASLRTRPGEGAHVTSGSLASWVSRLSRGRTTLRGSIASWQSIPGLPARRGEELDAWLRHLFASREIKDSDVDVWLVLHTSATLAEPTLLRAPGPGAKPLILMSTTAGSRSLLPLTRVARALLDAIGDRTIFRPLDASVLEDAALHAQLDDLHRPPPPLGIEMHAIGWAPLVLADVRNHVALRLPEIARGGFLLTLPTPGLEERGTVYLESRRLQPSLGSNANASAEGLSSIVGYWDMHGRNTVLARAGEASVTAGMVSLRANTWASSFKVGAERRRDFAVRDQVLVSAWGEACWRLRSVRRAEGNTPSFDLDALGFELLAPDRRLRLSARTPQSPSVPLTIDGPRGGSGFVSRSARKGAHMVRGTCPHRKGSVTRLSWDAIDIRDGARVVATFRGPRHRVRAVVRSAGRERSLPWIRGDESPRRITWTLPSTAGRGAQMAIEVEAIEGRRNDWFELEDLRLWRLTRAAVELFETGKARDVAATRGNAHFAPCLTLDAAKRPRLEFPIKVPDQGTLLRVAAIANAAGEDARIRVRFRELRERRIREVATLRPDPSGRPLLLCINLSPLRNRSGVLVFELQGAKSTVRLVEASIRYL